MPLGSTCLAYFSAHLLDLRFPTANFCIRRRVRVANRLSAVHGRGGEGDSDDAFDDSASRRHMQDVPPRSRTVAQSRSPIHTKSPGPVPAEPVSVGSPQACGHASQTRSGGPSNPAVPSNPQSASPRILCRKWARPVVSNQRVSAQTDGAVWLQLSTDGSARREPPHRRRLHHRPHRSIRRLHRPIPRSVFVPTYDHCPLGFRPSPPELDSGRRRQHRPATRLRPLNAS
ncbi:hypothetical protein CA85_03870 [Allorhodopirellula solitaria]|uniref:Uncharacterized protein n=1 Tax=Allorhodopirellula solitaria TaxID=2527987 RepID=A0A5C5YJV7_9BACT|nr:hypothetical protein CA85_03870 [Allorhodopirellula solitaria]